MSIVKQLAASDAVAPPTLATAAASVPGASPAAAAESPKTQPQTALLAADSAVLWIVEKLDAGDAVQSAVGSLAAKQQSGLIPNATVSLFGDEDDWLANVLVE